MTITTGDTVEFLDDGHIGMNRIGTVVAVYKDAITVDFGTYREVYELSKIKLSQEDFSNNWIVDWIQTK